MISGFWVPYYDHLTLILTKVLVKVLGGLRAMGGRRRPSGLDELQW